MTLDADVFANSSSAPVLVTGGLAAVPVATGTAAAAEVAGDPQRPAGADRPAGPRHASANSKPAACSRRSDSYDAARHTIAVVVAERLGLDAEVLESAWRDADFAHQEALMAAFSQLGVPYRHNTSKAGVGFDCSGLTTYAWAQAGVMPCRARAAVRSTRSPSARWTRPRPATSCTTRVTP